MRKKVRHTANKNKQTKMQRRELNEYYFEISDMNEILYLSINEIELRERQREINSGTMRISNCRYR